MIIGHWLCFADTFTYTSLNFFIEIYCEVCCIPGCQFRTLCSPHTAILSKISLLTSTRLNLYESPSLNFHVYHLCRHYAWFTRRCCTSRTAFVRNRNSQVLCLVQVPCRPSAVVMSTAAATRTTRTLATQTTMNALKKTASRSTTAPLMTTPNPWTVCRTPCALRTETEPRQRGGVTAVGTAAVRSPAVRRRRLTKAHGWRWWETACSTRREPVRRHLPASSAEVQRAADLVATKRSGIWVIRWPNCTKTSICDRQPDSAEASVAAAAAAAPLYRNCRDRPVSMSSPGWQLIRETDSSESFRRSRVPEAEYGLAADMDLLGWCRARRELQPTR